MDKNVNPFEYDESFIEFCEDEGYPKADFKNSIDDYVINNALNSSIYEALLGIQQDNDYLYIFNHAYYVCKLLEECPDPDFKWPEEFVEHLFLLLEMPEGAKYHISSENPEDFPNIVMSCVYVILFFSNSNNPHIGFCLTRIKSIVDQQFFRHFEPLLNGTNNTQLSPQIMEYDDEEVEKTPLKVCSIVIMEMLRLMGKGKSVNDISKICKLIAFLTGGSYNKIYNETIKGIALTKYHSSEILKVNKILSDLNISISIEKDKEY